jgi:catalase
MRSVELDAVVVASPDASDPRVATLLREAYRHAKAIGAVTAAQDILEACAVDSADEGVIVTDDPQQLATALTAAVAEHRAWARTMPV